MARCLQLAPPFSFYHYRLVATPRTSKVWPAGPHPQCRLQQHQATGIHKDHVRRIAPLQCVTNPGGTLHKHGSTLIDIEIVSLNPDVRSILIPRDSNSILN